MKVVAANLVSNTLGTINPIDRLTAWAHEQGAIMVVDAAQAVPHRRVDVQALGCDFLGFTSHKLCGPTGAGALYGRRELLERMSPFEMGGEMIRKVSIEETTWNDLPYKFEAGTPAFVEAYGLGAAIDYVTGGRPRRDRGARARRSRRWRWSGSPSSTGSRVYGPPAGRRAGIVSFNVDGVHPHDVAQILDSEGVAVRASHHCTQPLMRRLGIPATARASFYLYSIPEEIDRLVDGLHKVRKVLCLMDDQLYREIILDHYKNPRGHGVIEDADAEAEGMNPLCGDEVTIYVAFGEDGETIDEVKFSGRGCAISQAATSMLMEMAQGKTATEVATMPQRRAARGDRRAAPEQPDAAQVRAARPDDAQGRAAQGEGDAAARTASPASRRARAEVGCPSSTSARSTSCRPAGRRSSTRDSSSVCVYNLGGELYALEDRCSHDDGPLCEGDWDPDEGVVICPRHGANFDIRTGEALTLPAFEPVETYPVRVEDGIVKVELP